MPSLGTLLAGAASLALARTRKRKSPTPHSDDSLADQLQRQIDAHIDVHKSLDLRTTVYLLGYIGVVTVEGSLFKDNLSLLPAWFMLAVAIVTALGVTVTIIALFAGRWSSPARTSREILQEAKRLQNDLTGALTDHLALCKRISVRKRPASNASLILLGVLTELMTWGMAFFT